MHLGIGCPMVELVKYSKILIVTFVSHLAPVLVYILGKDLGCGANVQEQTILWRVRIIQAGGTGSSRKRCSTGRRSSLFYMSALMWVMVATWQHRRRVGSLLLIKVESQCPIARCSWLDN